MSAQTYRQSTLASFETCPRRCKADLDLMAANGIDPLSNDGYSVGNVGTTADLGSVFHAVAAEILRTLRRQGEDQMATEEAVVIMREVYAASKVVLPAQDRDSLRWLVLKLCEYRFPPKAILAIEQPLTLDLTCPDGVVRTLTGTPDLLMMVGGGIVIVDYKSGWAVPRKPRKLPPEGEPITGRQYLSDRGHFQLDTYGLLALEQYPGAPFAMLRELHLRSGEIREADVSRDDLEHLRYELGAHMQKLDGAIANPGDEQRWKPRPGRHCLRQCPVARSCPIPEEQRGEGALEGEAQADKMAEEYVIVDGLRDHLRGTLKAWHEETGHYANVGDGNVIGWQETDGKRRFEIHAPEDNDNGKAAA